MDIVLSNNTVIIFALYCSLILQFIFLGSTENPYYHFFWFLDLLFLVIQEKLAKYLPSQHSAYFAVFFTALIFMLEHFHTGVAAKKNWP